MLDDKTISSVVEYIIKTTTANYEKRYKYDSPFLLEDCLEFAFYGIIKALAKFDDSTGMPFRGYANRAAIGYILYRIRNSKRYKNSKFTYKDDISLNEIVNRIDGEETYLVDTLSTNDTDFEELITMEKILDCTRTEIDVQIINGKLLNYKNKDIAKMLDVPVGTILHSLQLMRERYYAGD